MTDALHQRLLRHLKLGRHDLAAKDLAQGAQVLNSDGLPDPSLWTTITHRQHGPANLAWLQSHGADLAREEPATLAHLATEALRHGQAALLPIFAQHGLALAAWRQHSNTWAAAIHSPHAQDAVDLYRHVHGQQPADWRNPYLSLLIGAGQETRRGEHLPKILAWVRGGIPSWTPAIWMGDGDKIYPTNHPLAALLRESHSYDASTTARLWRVFTRELGMDSRLVSELQPRDQRRTMAEQAASSSWWPAVVAQDRQERLETVATSSPPRPRHRA